MTNYNYLEAVTSDVLDYIKEEINLDEWKGNREGLEEKLNDELWTVDSVTGNASGSYTFNTWEVWKKWDFKPAAMPVNSTLTKCTNTGG